MHRTFPLLSAKRQINVEITEILICARDILWKLTILHNFMLLNMSMRELEELLIDLLKEGEMVVHLSVFHSSVKLNSMQ